MLASVTGIEPVLPVRETGVLGRCTTPTEEIDRARVWKPRVFRNADRERSASRACRASTSERLSWSQSMESNHPIRGYEPRPCASTDCDGVRLNARISEKVSREKIFARPSVEASIGLFP